MIVIRHKGVSHPLKAKTISKTVAKSHPTAARVRELLDYDTKTGKFSWKVSRGRCKAGSVAGSLDGEGNTQIRIDGRLYMTKQLALAHLSGVWTETDWHSRKLSRQYKG